jgi:LCP family protein required for cell wall assembly
MCDDRARGKAECSELLHGLAQASRLRQDGRRYGDLRIGGAQQDEPGMIDDTTTENRQPDRVIDDQSRRRTGRRSVVLLLICLAALLGVVLIAAGAMWWAFRDVSAGIERIPDAFDIPEQARPGPAAGGSLNFLLAGLDSEDSAGSFEQGEARTDAVMILHFNESRDEAYLISIPRDTWVPIPGHDENKINAAYSFGGPPLYVQTVEELTGLRMDHLAVIDWSGFRDLTDALGGVELTFDERVVTSDGSTYEPGTHTLSGKEALQYVRERKGLPAGDFDRVKRQQNYLRALLRQLQAGEILTDPGRLAEVAGSIADAAKVDDKLSATDLVGLALSLRSTENLTFLTVPTNGTGWAGEASIVVYDREGADELWAAVRADDVASYLAAHSDLVTGERVH